MKDNIGIIIGAGNPDRHETIRGEIIMPDDVIQQGKSIIDTSSATFLLHPHMGFSTFYTYGEKPGKMKINQKKLAKRRKANKAAKKARKK